MSDNPRDNKDAERKRQSENILRQIKQQETGKEFHPSERVESDDAVEIWGKRIGRGLGFIFLIYLIYTLTNQYIFVQS